MAKPKPAHHVLDVYDAHLHLALNQRQWKQIRREITSLDKKMDSSGAMAHTLFVPDKGHAVMHLAIWIALDDFEDDTAGLVNTIAHEAFHAAIRLLEHVGQPPDGDAEAHAYLVGWIAGWIWDHASARR